jgi:hypothetical protein
MLLLLLALQAAAPNDPPPELKSETPAAEATAPMFDPVTKIDGKFVQVVKGARAVFHLDDTGLPVLDKAETGQLAAAYKIGTVKEGFEAPETGQLAFAVDGSTEKRASYLKVWNQLDYPIAYSAVILVLQPGGRTLPVTVRTCAVAPGGTDLVTWPRPVLAVALSGFTKAADAKACK